MISDTIRAVDEAYKGATPGEWHDCEGYGDILWCKCEKTREIHIADMRGYGHFTAVDKMTPEQASKQMDANAAYIATAHNAWPAIRAELDRREKEIEGLRARLEAKEAEKSCTYSREDGNSEMFCCSVCDCEWTISNDDGETWNYCPCCGRRIKEVMNEDEAAEERRGPQKGAEHV